MPQPIRSMTGFARVRRATPLGELTLSLRAVNHRALDLHFHLPSGLDACETAMRKVISAAITRGHIDVRAQFTRVRGGASEFNRELLAAYVAVFRKAAEEYGLAGEPDLNAALRMPGMIVEEASGEDGPELEAAVLAAAQEAIAILNAEREREGAATATVLREYGKAIHQRAQTLKTMRGNVVPALQAKLRDRLTELLGGSVIDPTRIAQEAAIIADRSEIAEEITRLEIHARQLLDLLEAGGETGKKLEFLLQEMQREANTILSKAGAAGEPGRAVTDIGLAVKSDVEKLREQSLNLE